MPIFGLPGAGALIKIAEGRAISGASVASNNLSFVTGINLSTHIPTFAVIKYASGNLSGVQMRVLADALPITGDQTLSTIDSTHNGFAPCLAVVAISNDVSKVLKADVPVASEGASAFDVVVYGIPY